MVKYMHTKELFYNKFIIYYQEIPDLYTEICTHMLMPKSNKNFLGVKELCVEKLKKL